MSLVRYRVEPSDFSRTTVPREYCERSTTLAPSFSCRRFLALRSSITLGTPFWAMDSPEYSSKEIPSLP